MRDEDLAVVYGRGAAARELRTRVLSSKEIAARLAVCRACPQCRGIHPPRVACAAPCTTCRKRADGIVLRAVSLGMEQCPEARWSAGTVCKIGIVLPALNEGSEVRATIENFRETRLPGSEIRFWVVDDASEDDGCKVCNGLPGVTVHRNATRRGEAHNRNFGAVRACEAGVDGCIVHDSHMRQVGSGGHERMIATAIETGGLVCGVTHPLWDDPNKRDFARYGARLVWSEANSGKRVRAGLRAMWHNRPTGETRMPIQCLFGASYGMTCATYRKIGGWWDVRGMYGFGEEAMAIAAFFLDIPVYCQTDAHFQHKFRQVRPYPMSGVYWWRNFVYCTRILFGDETFTRVFAPVALRIVGSQVRAELKLDLRAEQEAWAAKKLHTNEEALAWLKIK